MTDGPRCRIHSLLRADFIHASRAAVSDLQHTSLFCPNVAAKVFERPTKQFTIPSPYLADKMLFKLLAFHFGGANIEEGGFIQRDAYLLVLRLLQVSHGDCQCLDRQCKLWGFFPQGFFPQGFLNNGKRPFLTTKEITGIHLQDTESDLNRVRLEMFSAAGRNMFTDFLRTSP
jgi:hypothetical protein